jgi:hypothetical protein
MKFYRVVLPRAGNLVKGPNGRSVFSYVYWSPDPIFDDVSEYCITKSFAERIVEFSGFDLLDVVETRTEKEYEQPSNRLAPEPVLCLRVYGRAGVDDFGKQDRSTLIVSERVINEMRAAGAVEVEIFDYDPSYRPPQTLQELRKEAIERKARFDARFKKVI